VICPKFRCEDYSIVAGILASRLPKLGWRLVELKDKTHRQVARTMQDSAFHVSVNCQESFNATVPEAMAAGCVPICYEAFGGQDFLEDGKNAHVFPNHHIYPLLERTLDLVHRYDRIQPELMKMRRAAHATVARFTEKQTAKALLAYFRTLLLP
jgi:glycosyltransferase involved in cell wall biosynthesis